MKIIYHGSQFVHKTTNQGITWEKISPDLTEFDPSKQVISGSPITRDVTEKNSIALFILLENLTLKKGRFGLDPMMD